LKQLSEAPLAQLPTGRAKKFIYVTPTKVYKGPFDATSAKDVNVLQRALYRINRMKGWGDTILLDQELVYNEEESKLYLCSDFIGSVVDPHKWKIEGKELNTHKGCGPVNILNRESTGVHQMSKLIQNPIFEGCVKQCIIDLAARYLIGSGDAHLGNIICSSDGKSVVAIDIEENRENIPTKSENNKLTLLDCIFIKGKNPSKRDVDKFESLVAESLPNVAEFVAGVSNENQEESAQKAKLLQYNDGPTKTQVLDRIATLQECIAQFKRDSSKKTKRTKCSSSYF